MADVIVMGVGVRPATDYLHASGWALEQDGSVRVDDHLKVIGKQNIYAVGDIATYPQIDGEPRRIEHWNVCAADMLHSYPIFDTVKCLT